MRQFNHLSFPDEREENFLINQTALLLVTRRVNDVMIAQTLGEIFILFDGEPALIIAFDGECVTSTRSATEISATANTKFSAKVLREFKRRQLDLTVWLVRIRWCTFQ